MQNSSCDCSSGNSGNNMFNMNMGNPQHQLNLNQAPMRMADQNNLGVDLGTAMGLPNNVMNSVNQQQQPQQQMYDQQQQQQMVGQQQQINNVVKKDLVDSLNKIATGDNTVRGAVHDSYYILLKNINLAFILVAAFAWNDAVKFYIAKLIRSQQGSPYYYLYYALIVTLLAVISVRLTRKFLIGN